jgi:hypothetical protein
MPNFNFWIIIIITTIITFSCSNDSETIEDDINSSNNQIANINLPDQLGLDSGEIKIFTMPTPLQIATALKIMEVDYNNHLLLENGIVAPESDIKLSMVLGMYLTDLGYTTIYNNTQKSLSYANDIQLIMNELPIGHYLNDGFRNSFKSNLDNQDSLCKIILEGYNEANQYISETENEGLGLLILTGAYIEGLYLVTSSNIPSKWMQENNNILIQQKLFIDNFVVLLEGYSGNSEIATLLSKLKQLKTAFDEVDIYFNDKTESYELRNPITQIKKDNIKVICSKIRNDIIAPNK